MQYVSHENKRLIKDGIFKYHKSIEILPLTHWGGVMHVCASKLTIIGSDNGLLPGWCQAIIWTNAGILLIRSLGRYFGERLIEIHTSSFKKMDLKMPLTKWHLFCLCLNVLTYWWRFWSWHSTSAHWYRQGDSNISLWKLDHKVGSQSIEQTESHKKHIKDK